MHEAMRSISNHQTNDIDPQFSRAFRMPSKTEGRYIIGLV